MNNAITSNNASTVGKKYTVKEFLDEFSVRIPMLQRDYAQGREDKGYIRKKFLLEIKETIENGKTLTLDFIYGYKDKNTNEVFFPLDGQQRLTTVWLVYWYLVLKANKLIDEKKALGKFSYETRKSSREFCKALCSNAIRPQSNETVVEFIQKQTWFFAAWKKDPSINAMLRTLGGTGNDDGIEPLLGSLAKKSNKWESFLESFKNNIQFYVLDIGDEQMPTESAERLYVKMNARGKSLTDFENFKADLIFYIKNEFKDERLNNRNPDIEISAKMDNDWNDIFWESARAGNGDGQTDEIFFAFINRYCYNLLCINSSPSFSGLIRKIDDILDENNANGKIDDDKKINFSDDQKNDLRKYKYFTEEDHSYEDFESFYKDLLNFDAVQSLYSVFDHLKRHVAEINDVLDNINRIVGKRESANYRFIPYYEKEKGYKVFITDKGGNKVGKVKGTTYKERLYFFAICEYLEKNEFDTASFLGWMRFCRNIIENYGIDSVSAMISCMNHLNEFRENTNNIYDFLSSYSYALPSKPSKYDYQLAEEIEKSKHSGNSDIIDAENYSIFCGHIGFLFTDGNGNFDWNSYADKYNTTKTIFNDNTGKVDYGTVKKYAESFKDFDAVKDQDRLIFHQNGWQHRGDNWLDVLDNDADRADKLLTDSLPKVSSGTYDTFLQSQTYKMIVEKSNIMTGEKDLRIAWYHNKWALYKKSAQNGKLYFDDANFKRNSKIREILNTTSISKFVIDQKSDFNLSESYFWGEDITFSYNGKSYIWTSDDEIFEFKPNKTKTMKLDSASLKPVAEIISML